MGVGGGRGSRDTSMGLTDSAPWGQDSLGSFRVSDEKGEKERTAKVIGNLHTLGQAVKQQCLVYGVSYGEEEVNERALAIQ